MERIHLNSNLSQNHGNSSFYRKLTSSSLVLTTITFLLASITFALPQDGTVQSGDVKINQIDPKRLDINQSSDKAIIDWQSFNIAEDEHTHFQLPSNNSINLSRVTGGQRSDIFGKLSSNGQLMLVNPNGVVFGQNSRIDVHGLVATTSNIRNEDFLANRFHFNIPGNPSAMIVNRGTINIGNAGLLAFVAPGVQNYGIINARLGRVGLASSNQFTLDLYGDNLISIGIEGKVLEKIYGEDGKPISSLVDQSGTINAQGGQVYLQTNAARDIVDHAINVSGIIEAKTAVKQRGQIILNGGNEGKVKVSGVLDASGLENGQTGGTVHVLGDEVILEKARIFASGFNGGGTVLVGGDYQGKGSVLTAKNTYFDTESVIYGDAIYEGNGGKIILWADERTDALGKIYARGGSVGGDGGFVETSGKERLVVTQAADVSAPNGKAGEWLLDPFDIEIVDSLDNAKLAGGNKIDVAIINAALNNGTSVKIQSNNNGEGEGNILLSSAIVKTSGGDSTLTLDAAGGITINKSITSSAGALTLDLIAATGVVLNESLDLNGGSVTLNSNETFIRPNSVNPGGQNIVQSTHVSGVSQGAVAHVSGSPGVGAVHISGNQNKTNASANHGNDIILGEFFDKRKVIEKTYINEEGKEITYKTFTVKDHIETSGGNVTFKDKVKVVADVNSEKRTLSGLPNFTFYSDDFRINTGGGNINFEDKLSVSSRGFILDSEGGSVAFRDNVYLASSIFVVNSKNGKVLFNSSLNSSFQNKNELRNPTLSFFLDAGNVTFNEIGNLRPFKSFYVSSSSTVKFLGRSNFNGNFSVRAKNGIEILDNMTTTALGNGYGANAPLFDADSDSDGIGAFRIAKGKKYTKTGQLSITAAKFDILRKIDEKSGSIYIYDTKINKGFSNRDFSYYAHLSGSSTASSSNNSNNVTKVNSPSINSNIATSVSQRISGNSTPNIAVTQTNSTKSIKNKSAQLASSISANERNQFGETPEQLAINAVIAEKNRKIDNEIKEIRNRLVASSVTARQKLPVNNISSGQAFQQRVNKVQIQPVRNPLFTSSAKARQNLPVNNISSGQAFQPGVNKTLIPQTNNPLVASSTTSRQSLPEDNKDSEIALQQKVSNMWDRLVGSKNNTNTDSEEEKAK